MNAPNNIISMNNVHWTPENAFSTEAEKEANTSVEKKNWTKLSRCFTYEINHNSDTTPRSQWSNLFISFSRFFFQRSVSTHENARTQYAHLSSMKWNAIYLWHRRGIIVCVHRTLFSLCFFACRDYFFRETIFIWNDFPAIIRVLNREMFFSSRVQFHPLHDLCATIKVHILFFSTFVAKNVHN